MPTGTISVQTENIFPIIKKALYSDQEIFLRELVSNAVDATTKLKTLARKGVVDQELGDLTIDILLDEEAKTLTVRDRGIGLTQDEAEKYLNQVAFSSAHEFLEKYQEDAKIIGAFGLGFYSAFMVASKVEAISRSWQADAQGITWSCEGSPEYSIEYNDKAERGTDIVLHLAEDAEEFLKKERIQELLDKYCKFLPIPIRFGTKSETITEGEGEEAETKTVEVDNMVNNSDPAWTKSPNDLSDEDYRNFYRELYPTSFEQPLFWIHLNIDHPFNLTGILYFPKLKNTFEIQQNKIQLYSNQVYVTDDVKEIVPEFLTLLHGVIDSPDIPLNVSRSYLQSDSSVRKITGYITRKVADKLSELFEEDRNDFESKWNDLGVFIKYGAISEEKFYDRAKDTILLPSTEEGKYFTLEEYREKVRELQTDKHERVIFLYASNADTQFTQIEACKNRGYEVLLMDHPIDNHFIQQLEMKGDKISFVRVDSDTIDNLVQKDEQKESVLGEKEQETVKKLFEAHISDSGAQVELKALSPEDQPVAITRPEYLRRMTEMQAMQGMGGAFPDSYSVIVNTNHPIVASKLLQTKGEADQQQLVEYLYQLALLNQGMLKGAALSKFVNRSLGFLD